MATTRFAHILRQQRLAHGLTQEQLAERARLSVRAISDLERSINNSPRLSTVRMLAQALALESQATAALLETARPADAGKPAGANPGPASPR